MRCKAEFGLGVIIMIIWPCPFVSPKNPLCLFDVHSKDVWNKENMNTVDLIWKGAQICRLRVDGYRNQHREMCLPRQMLSSLDSRFSLHKLRKQAR